jgi:hypothetical protein
MFFFNSISCDSHCDLAIVYNKYACILFCVSASAVSLQNFIAFTWRYYEKTMYKEIIKYFSSVLR